MRYSELREARRGVAAALVALIACLGACGGDNSSDRQTRAAPPPPPAASVSAEPLPPAPAAVDVDPGVEGQIGVQNSAGRSGMYFIPERSAFKSFPLLVILHGTGQSGASMIERFRDLAQTHGFAIVAPDSRLTEGPGTWEVGDKQGDVTPDLTHTLNCIDWVRSQGLNVEESHVLIAGYSGGASSAPYIGSNRPGFTHIAVLHGGLYPGGIGSQRTPVWFSTGDQDQLRPPALVRQSADALVSLGFSDITFRTYPGGHGLSEIERSQLIDWWLGR